MQPIAKFTGKNKAIMVEYQRRLLLNQKIDQSSINNYLWKIYAALRYFNFKPVNKITKTDIEDYILLRRKNNKVSTVDTDIIILGKFFKWFNSENGLKNDFFEGIKIRRENRNLPDRIIGTKEIKKFLSVCKSQRDRAFIFVLWDSGCRLSEILGININHIQFDEYGATIIVDGKTGKRKVRLIESVPDLRLWLNMHPLKENPDAPLFVTDRRYSYKQSRVIENRRLQARTVQGIFKRIGNLAGYKNLHPHALRHGRMTDFAKMGMRETDLRIIAGWKRNSDMPTIYIHLSGEDVDEKRLMISGIKKDKDVTLNTLKPGKCPRCQENNPIDAKYCLRCGLALDKDTERWVQETSNKLNNLLSNLQKERPDIIKIIFENMSIGKK